jgi:hypothetical protein
VLEPHRRAAERPKQNIETTYWPGKGEFDAYEQSFRSLRMLETVAGHLADQYVWPHPIGLEMASRGEINAKWQAGNRKTFLCYELAQDFAQLYRGYGQEWNPSQREMVAAKILESNEADTLTRLRCDCIRVHGAPDGC